MLESCEFGSLEMSQNSGIYIAQSLRKGNNGMR